MTTPRLLGFFFSWKGEIGRSAYAFTGIALFLIKWNLDRLFSILLQSEDYPTLLLPVARNRLHGGRRSNPHNPSRLCPRPPLYLRWDCPYGQKAPLARVAHLLLRPLFVPFVNLLFFSCFPSCPKTRVPDTRKRQKGSRLARPFSPPRTSRLRRPGGRPFGGPRYSVRLLQPTD